MPADFYIANTTTAVVSCDGLAWSGSEALPFECECNGVWIDRIRRSSQIWAKIQAGTLELQDAGGNAIPLVSGTGVGIQQAFEFLVKTDSPNAAATDCITLTACAPILAGQPVTLDAAGLACPASNADKDTATLAGIAITSALAGEPVEVCCSGNVCLTVAEWDAVAGTTGGLTPGAKYWLGPSGLVDVRPTTWIVCVGSAASADCLCFTPDRDPCKGRPLP